MNPIQSHWSNLAIHLFNSAGFTVIFILPSSKHFRIEAIGSIPELTSRQIKPIQLTYIWKQAPTLNRSSWQRCQLSSVQPKWIRSGLFIYLFFFSNETGNVVKNRSKIKNCRIKYQIKLHEIKPATLTAELTNQRTASIPNRGSIHHWMNPAQTGFSPANSRNWRCRPLNPANPSGCRTRPKNNPW